MLLQVLPPLALYCHWYSSPEPEAATVKVAFSPEATVWASGWEVIFSAAAKVSFAPSEVTVLPLLSVTTQRYWRPLTVEDAVTFSVAVL